MLAVSGIAASAASHRLASQTSNTSSSRSDGGRGKVEQEMAAWWMPRKLKEMGACVAWQVLMAGQALAEEDSILGPDAASVYARMTGLGGQSDVVETGETNFQFPDLSFQLPDFSFQLPDFSFQLPDISKVQLPEVDFSVVADKPELVVVGALALAVPLLLSQILGNRKAQAFGSVSAKDAYMKLADAEGGAQLVDIRPAEDVKAEGTPDLRAYKKRVFQLPFSAEEAEEDEIAAYMSKLKLRLKKPEETTLYFLDSFDGSSLALAKLATENGFLAAYAIKGGAEGPNGWRQAELPWLEPSKGFKLDLGVFKEALDSTFGAESGSVVPVTLGVAAAAAAGAVVFSEAETTLQLLGSAALIQLFVKKFLFAKDRELTVAQIKELLDTKVAPQGLMEDIKKIGTAVVSTAREITGQVVGDDAPPPTTSPAAADDPSLNGAVAEFEAEVEAAAGEPVPDPDSAPVAAAEAAVEAKAATSPVPEEPVFG